MKPTEDLFYLIKSLDKNEKRYFTLFSSMHSGDKKYMLLFDAIDKQQKYDELSIKKKFHGHAFIRQLTFTKNYLYTLILKSMRSYCSEKTAEMRMKNNLQDIKFLSGKGLYKQCEKILLLTKQSANKYDKHLILLESLWWEIGLIRDRSFEGKPEEIVTRIYEEMFRIADKFIKSNRYYYAASQIASKLQKKGYPREKKDYLMYQKAFKHVLSATTDESSLSYRELYYYYSCCNMYFFTQNDFQNMYLSASKLVKLLEENSHQISENSYQYVAAFYNFLLCQLNLKKYKEMFLSIKKFREIHVDSKYIKNEIFFLSNDMELIIYNNTGEFSKGIKLINAIRGEFEERGIATLNMQHRTTVYFTIACVYFGAGNYVATNIWLNKIINEEVDIRSDYHCFAKILKLITYFELNNQDLLEYAVKSTYRFLDKRKRLYQFETLVLDFIRKKMPKINSQKKLIDAFASLKKSIEKIIKDPFEKKALDYFDFISWLESKIKNRSFAEIVKEKALVH